MMLMAYCSWDFGRAVYVIGLFDILSIFFDSPTSKEMEQAEIDIENARASGDKKRIVRTVLVYIFGILAAVVCIAVTVSIFFK